MKRPKIATRRNDPAGLHARILDAAAELFHQRGYHTTGMREVMSATGTTAGALHHHFPTKEALAHAVIADRVAPTVRETWIDPCRRAKSLAQGIHLVFAEIIQGIDRRGAVMGCPLNNLALELAYGDPQFRDALRAIFIEWQEALEERLAQTPGGRRLDRAARAAAAAFIIAGYSGAMNMAKVTQSAAPLRNVAHTLSEWLHEHRFVS